MHDQRYFAFRFKASSFLSEHTIKEAAVDNFKTSFQSDLIGVWCSKHHLPHVFQKRVVK